MSDFKQRLIETAEREWRLFGGSLRSLDEEWTIVGDQADEPFKSRVGDYWRAVGRPEWDGDTDEPWSAAFISWCFAEAGAGDRFSPDETHSVYMDRIRRHDGMSQALVLHPPGAVPVAPGDLVWNSRRPGPHYPYPGHPLSYGEAVDLLEAGIFFASHTDIVVSVAGGRCDSIGGNVCNVEDGGSVTRSTWRLDWDGRLVDPRKDWIGVVKNGL
jgi:hypothetical protein